MGYVLTDNMSVLEMMIAREEYQIRRFHSKNSRDEDWPSDEEISNDAVCTINSYTNVELLEQMQSVLDDRKEQRKRRNETGK